jgi:hypothetical protein
VIKEYFDFHKFWSDIRDMRYKGMLEDFETALEDITLERAEEFIDFPLYDLNIDECMIDGSDVCLCFSEEEYAGDSMNETQGFSIWMRVNTEEDCVITWMRSEQW